MIYQIQSVFPDVITYECRQINAGSANYCNFLLGKLAAMWEMILELIIMTEALYSAIKIPFQ